MDKNIKKKDSSKIGRQDELVLKKHVGLIHCENKLTLIQRKICNILLFNALDKINECEIHEISLRKLCSLVGYNSNDSNLIKASIKTLISVVMEWNLLEDSKFINEENYPEDAISWNASSLLAGASIKAGIVKYSYSPQIKSVLSSLEIYGRINLFVQAKFNSSYSLVLYENCVRFKNIKQTSWFTIELFRSLMGVSGDKYSSFKEFKRNVITPAVKEINQKSDIFIEVQFRKSGRNIIALQFLIKENSQYLPVFRKPQQQNELGEKALLLEVLTSHYQFSPKKAAQLLTEYDADYLKEKHALVSEKKKIDHPGAYLISALKNDYQAKITVKEEIKREDTNSYLREAKQASEISTLKNKYMTYKLNQYQADIAALDPVLQKQIQQQFQDLIATKPEISRFYHKSKLASPFVKVEFIQFIEKYFPTRVGPLLSFDDFISSEESDIAYSEYA